MGTIISGALAAQRQNDQQAFTAARDQTLTKADRIRMQRENRGIREAQRAYQEWEARVKAEGADPARRLLRDKTMQRVYEESRKPLWPNVD
jgi:hypothetical protein